MSPIAFALGVVGLAHLFGQVGPVHIQKLPGLGFSKPTEKILEGLEFEVKQTGVLLLGQLVGVFAETEEEGLR